MKISERKLRRLIREVVEGGGDGDDHISYIEDHFVENDSESLSSLPLYSESQRDPAWAEESIGGVDSGLTLEKLLPSVLIGDDSVRIDDLIYLDTEEHAGTIDGIGYDLGRFNSELSGENVITAGGITFIKSTIEIQGVSYDCIKGEIGHYGHFLLIDARDRVKPVEQSARAPRTPGRQLYTAQ